MRATAAPTKYSRASVCACSTRMSAVQSTTFSSCRACSPTSDSFLNRSNVSCSVVHPVRIDAAMGLVSGSGIVRANISRWCLRRCCCAILTCVWQRLDSKTARSSNALLDCRCHFIGFFLQRAQQLPPHSFTIVMHVKKKGIPV